MTVSPAGEGNGLAGGVADWLERPRPWWWCVGGWIVASAVFIAGTQLLGGPTSGDAGDSINTTWAFAHGMFACGYAPGNEYGLPYSAPLYPLISGAVVALLRIGHSVVFPAGGQFGVHCSTAVEALYHWTLASGALAPTLRIGYVTWFALMFGAVLLLRTVGRGRSAWEILTVLMLAVTPPVFMCLHEYFHPQDLLAMGLIFGGLAMVQRQSWLMAGLLLGLAVTSQQYALLAVIPLLVLVPRRSINRYVVGIAGALVLIAAPLSALAGSGALKALVTGSGATWTSSTLIGEIRISSSVLIVLSRVAPFVAALLLAWWAESRLGAKVLEAGPLLSVISTSLAFRLLFEVNLWGYYFMALAVTLLIQCVLRRRLKISWVLWLVAITVAFHPVVGATSSLSAVSTPWFPLWLWQLVLVGWGVYLAVQPLMAAVADDRIILRDGSSTSSHQI